jgi:hypothetical protein
MFRGQLASRLSVRLGHRGAEHCEPGFAELLVFGAFLDFGGRQVGVEQLGFLGRAGAFVVVVAPFAAAPAVEAGRGHAATSRSLG